LRQDWKTSRIRPPISGVLQAFALVLAGILSTTGDGDAGSDAEVATAVEATHHEVLAAKEPL
jgi:hypothetical protein